MCTLAPLLYFPLVHLYNSSQHTSGFTLDHSYTHSHLRSPIKLKILLAQTGHRSQAPLKISAKSADVEADVSADFLLCIQLVNLTQYRIIISVANDALHLMARQFN